jgi:acyl-ACP--UDP-N-acetylglucosamine O-acyltransferase
MTNIHPSSVVDRNAKIHPTVQIGPFCVVGPKVTLGENVKLVNHVCVDGATTIGDGTTVFPFASLGQPPQSLAYNGEPVELIIGKNNIIREHVTMNPGTARGGAMTASSAATACLPITRWLAGMWLSTTSSGSAAALPYTSSAALVVMPSWVAWLVSKET